MNQAWGQRGGTPGMERLTPVTVPHASIPALAPSQLRGMSLVLAGLLFLSACGGPAPAPSATVAATLTVAPSVTSTSTPSPIATAPPSTATPLPPTATVETPSVAVPSPTVASASPVPATPASVLYVANFATWFIGEEGGALPFRTRYDSATGEYRLALTDATRGYVYYRYAPEGRGFTDFRLDVEARRVAGPTNGGSYGVVFRAQPSNSSDRPTAQYNFFLNADGTFALNLLPPTGPAMSIVPRTAAPVINTGEATNRLAVICQGDRITLVINDQIVGTYEATLRGTGAIGLYVANPANSAGPVGMEVAFKNLRVSALPAAGSLSRPLSETRSAVLVRFAPLTLYGSVR